MNYSTDTLSNLKESVDFIRERSSFIPEIGIVLGSGLGAFVKEVAAEISLPFSKIPHFSPTTIVGHDGNLILGKVKDKRVAVLQGRSHFYEGHSMTSVIFPTRLLGLLGIKTLILTNSAGGIAEGMVAGDFMLIDDHLNLSGTNPLIGPNISTLGPRFPDMSEPYSRALTDTWAHQLQKSGVRYHRGVYAGMSGPTYETPAEVRYLKTLGCSAVGMSTVWECIAANHMSIPVVAMSCISNLAAGIAKHKLTHEEVTATGKKVEAQFTAAVKNFVISLNK